MKPDFERELTCGSIYIKVKSLCHFSDTKQIIICVWEIHGASGHVHAPDFGCALPGGVDVLVKIQLIVHLGYKHLLS